MNGSVQDCSNFSALAMELLQSWAEPFIMVSQDQDINASGTCNSFLPVFSLPVWTHGDWNQMAYIFQTTSIAFTGPQVKEWFLTGNLVSLVGTANILSNL